jgi:FkbM family methyltransferase
MRLAKNNIAGYMIGRLIEIVREQGLIGGLREIIRRVGNKAHHRLIITYLKLRNDDNLVLRNIQGSKMYLDLSDLGLSWELIVRGIHEERATKVLRQEVKEGMTVVDIGANLGYYALMEASIVGDKGQVYALEPVRRNFDILCKNIRANGYENVKAYCIAVSSSSGTAKMTLTNRSNWGSLLDVNGEAVSEYAKANKNRLPKQIVEVPTISLDEFLAEQGVHQVNFIRMDLEGYEIEVIKGMTNTLENMPSPLKLFIEMHCKAFTNPEDTIGSLLQRLLNLGFTPKWILPSGDRVIHGVRRDDLVRLVCSDKFACPHVLLEK